MWNNGNNSCLWIILIIILLACFTANWIVPEEMVTAYDTQARLQPPSC